MHLRGLADRRAWRLGGGGGHSHMVVRRIYPQGFSGVVSYPQAFLRGLIGRERGGIVVA